MLVSNLYSVFLLKFTHYNGSLWMQRFTQYFEFSLLSFFYCVAERRTNLRFGWIGGQFSCSVTPVSDVFIHLDQLRQNGAGYASKEFEATAL